MILFISKLFLTKLGKVLFYIAIYYLTVKCTYTSIKYLYKKLSK